MNNKRLEFAFTVFVTPICVIKHLLEYHISHYPHTVQNNFWFNYNFNSNKKRWI